jgi:nicotinamide-nucleotide amidase
LAAAAVKKILGASVFSEKRQSLPEVVGDLLRERGWTLALAESCTGGMISSLFCDTSCSDYFIGDRTADDAAAAAAVEAA